MKPDLKQTFEKLIKSEVKYQSSNFGFNLLISRLQRKYSSNASMAELNNCLQEMNEFCERYEPIMSKDIDAMRKI